MVGDLWSVLTQCQRLFTWEKIQCLLAERARDDAE